MAGRPTDYTDKIIEKSEEYLASCFEVKTVYDMSKAPAGKKGSRATASRFIQVVRIPTIEGLADHLNVHRDTLYAWSKTYPAFSDILESLRQKQANALIQRGLDGTYNPTIAKVLLVKHGYRDAHEVTGKDGEKLFDDQAKAKADAAVGQFLGAGNPEQRG